MNIQRLLKKSIRTLKAYNASEIPCRVKLDANESPYAFPALMERAKEAHSNRYPDPECSELKRAAAKRWQIKSEMILPGNGSDELIYNLIATFGGPVLFPTPTFSMYGIIAQVLGEESIGVPLNDNFDLDLKKMLDAVMRHKPKLVFLSSPNNPTGNCFSSERIFRIIKSSRSGLVILDEAYQPFSSSKGMLPLINEFENIAIMRTLSKVGFASLRVGFLIGQEGIIEAVNRVRLPFNLNSLSQATAVEAFSNYREVSKTVTVIRRERERVYRELEKIVGVTPYPSEANFILFSLSNASLVYERLLSAGVLIRNMESALKNSLRVTVGTPEENSIFLSAIKKILQ